MQKIYKTLLGISAILGLTAIGTLILGSGLNITGIFVIAALVCLAIGGLGKPALKPLAFTIWVIVAVAIGMFFPEYFRQIGDFKMTKLIVPLIQLIMFRSCWNRAEVVFLGGFCLCQNRAESHSPDESWVDDFQVVNPLIGCDIYV